MQEPSQDWISLLLEQEPDSWLAEAQVARAPRCCRVTRCIPASHAASWSQASGRMGSQSSQQAPEREAKADRCAAPCCVAAGVDRPRRSLSRAPTCSCKVSGDTSVGPELEASFLDEFSLPELNDLLHDPLGADLSCCRPCSEAQRGSPDAATQPQVSSSGRASLAVPARTGRARQAAAARRPGPQRQQPCRTPCANQRTPPAARTARTPPWTRPATLAPPGRRLRKWPRSRQATEAAQRLALRRTLRRRASAGRRERTRAGQSRRAPWSSAAGSCNPRTCSSQARACPPHTPVRQPWSAQQARPVATSLLGQSTARLAGVSPRACRCWS